MSGKTPMNFTETLLKCQRKGKLTVGDLHWFFRRPYHTVRCWVVNHRLPSGPGKEDAERELVRLQQFVSDKLLPPHKELSKRNRATYMRLLGGGVREYLGISETDPSQKGTVYRVLTKGKHTKAVGVRKRSRADRHAVG